MPFRPSRRRSSAAATTLLALVGLLCGRCAPASAQTGDARPISGDELGEARSPLFRAAPARPEVDPDASPATVPFPRLWRSTFDPPNGFTGRSSVVPREEQTDPHFVPMEDRWRIGFPAWDRYDKGHPVVDDYPYIPGRIFDPYNQNVLKGDFPVIGQHTFMNLFAQVQSFQEFRQIPAVTTPFESTAGPFERNFFQRPNQYFTTNFFFLGADFTHGDAGFKQPDWRIRIMPAFNVNSLSVQENAIVSPNVLQGRTRTRTFWTLQEAFFETKLADVSTEYDVVSLRIGSQSFVSDFRGFLFADLNDGVRLFGTRNGNRDQWNLAYFRQRLKDTNSQLNKFKDRGQDLVFANYYRQDFIWPGYTAQASFAYDHDAKSFAFNKNRFLVRPDPVGLARPHELNIGYLGWGGDGHIGRFNVSHQFYWAIGRDDLNPLANRAQTVNAQMFAVEGSYDRDWARFRTSFFWASGDRNINDGKATGFDSILDAPAFGGGAFSYWNRQQLPLVGVNLTQRLSLLPNLRTDKFQSQANFVNPGLLMPTFGVDFELTPKLRMINNLNFLWFDQTNALEQYLFQGHIHKYIGADLATGFEYRPLLSENVSFLTGVSTLVTGQGFQDVYNNGFDRNQGLFAGFLVMTLSY